MNIELAVPVNATDTKNAANHHLITDENKLILHTNISQALFHGKWRVGRMGLVQFASQMTILWKAFHDDDPYAEKYLLDTCDAIEKSKKKLEVYEAQLAEQMTHMRGFVINLRYHPSPLMYPLRFATVFPYMAAVVIEKVDYVNRQLYTMKKMGIIPENNLIPKALLREVQTIFRIPATWKHTGVTRKDILEGNQVAQLAQKKFGELSPAIFDKKINSRFLPRRK